MEFHCVHFYLGLLNTLRQTRRYTRLNDDL